MASITVRDLDELTKKRLRLRAATHNRSMEEEARHILRAAVAEDDATATDMATAIRQRFQPFGGVEVALPDREPIRNPPGLDRRRK
jgi:plasmid stability protein